MSTKALENNIKLQTTVKRNLLFAGIDRPGCLDTVPILRFFLLAVLIIAYLFPAGKKGSEVECSLWGCIIHKDSVISKGLRDRVR